MVYSVRQISKISGISVRSLHYYDEISLLKPSFIKKNGYRFYEEKELQKLQQILFFRELEFPLEKIKQIMESPGFDPLSALEGQRKLLVLKKKRTEKLIQTIQKTISSMKGGESMTSDDKFSAFNDPAYLKYKDEAEDRWGNTDAYKQSMVRVGKMSKADLNRIKAEGEDIRKETAKLMTKGLSHENPEVQNQIERFYKHLHNFYDPSYEMFKGLGQMYVDDPRFKEVYENQAKGLAVFMRDAMAFYSNKHE